MFKSAAERLGVFMALAMFCALAFLTHSPPAAFGHRTSEGAGISKSLAGLNAAEDMAGGLTRTAYEPFRMRADTNAMNSLMTSFTPAVSTGHDLVGTTPYTFDHRMRTVAKHELNATIAGTSNHLDHPLGVGSSGGRSPDGIRTFLI